jgi:formate hydrogenlyase transcriptional activator
MGTLFLDEVGDIPLELQSKLLRVLQEQEIERLGTSRTVRVNFRHVAATNRNLAQMVGRGQFRSDLYYRLAIFPIQIPSLRERRDDIVALTWNFIDKYARRMNKQIETVPQEALDALARHNWPGNIRELQNIIERSVILSQGTVLELCRLESATFSERAHPESMTLDESQREHILQALRDTDGVIGGPDGAAAGLNVKRTTLLYKVRRLGISRSTA